MTSLPSRSIGAVSTPSQVQGGAQVLLAEKVANSWKSIWGGKYPGTVFGMEYLLQFPLLL